MQTKKTQSFLLIATSIFMIIWLLATEGHWVHGSWPSIWKGGGSALGAAGYFLISLSLFLSSRWRKLEDWLGGLDQIYRMHHKLGIWGFTLILIHPFVIAIKWLPYRIDKFLLFFFPVHDRLSVNIGSLALWLMIFSVGVTVLKVFSYDKWKLTHKLMSLVFLLASYHVFFSENKISHSSLSHDMMYFPFLIGLFGILYKQVYIDYLKKKPVYRVFNASRVNDTVIQVDLIPENGKIDYSPGQYFFFSFADDHLTNESHPFTPISSPNRSQLSIMAKSRGDYTNCLYRELNEGSRAFLEGPYGRFDYSKAGKSQVWIAGGVGIAPFISWAGSLRESGDDRSVDLFYCFHRKADAVFVEEFERASRELPNFRFFLFCSEENNRLNAEKVERLCNGLEEKDILMCGPKRLTDNLTAQLISLGVNRGKIMFEDFDLL